MAMEGIKLVSTSISPTNELQCIKLQIVTKEIQESLIQSLYHTRILKCRLLISLIPEILASPISDTDYNDVYIIAKTEFILTGKIQEKLNAVNIKYSDSLTIKLTQKVYEACLYYTMLFKIAPAWNKVDKYLLQGTNFLASLAEPTNAMKIKIDITADSRTRLSLLQATVKVPQVSLEHFSLSQKIIRNFVNHDDGFIIINGSGLHTSVFVLPSLKTGKVISISKQIPETSGLKNYQELKKHWKNMYGYKLPETDFGLIYYQIYFPGFGETVYTYPDCCVRSSKLKYLNINNSEDTASQFIRDLKEKVPEIFGAKLHLQELNAELRYDDSRKENREVKIPNMMQWIQKNADKICNREKMESATQSRSTNYNSPCATSRSGSDSHRRALLTVSNNPGSKRVTYNMRKDKNLYNVLDMKSFLRDQSSKKNASAPRSTEFQPQIVETKRLVERPNLMKIYSNFFGSESKSKKFHETKTKVETITSSELEKSDDSNGEKNESITSLLRSRSSFDLNDFATELDEENLSNSNLVADRLSKGEEVEIKSPYFKDLENGSKSREEKLECKTSSSKLKFYRLNSKKETITSSMKHRYEINFNTKDISTYFKEKKQVKVSKVSEFIVKNKNSPPTFVQTQLNVKRSGKVELSFENKKKKFTSDN